MIDWDRVAELQEEVGQDGFCEVVALFLEETDEVVARLARHETAQELGCDLHFLKGSALNLGLRALAQLCQEGERLCEGGTADRVNLPTLRRLYEESKAALRLGHADRPAA